MEEDGKKKSEVKISAPWGGFQQQSNTGYFNDPDAHRTFIEERSKVHKTYILEQEKTKRISLFSSVLLFIVAVCAVLFAPPGREELSYWIGATLLVFSAGAAGYKRLWAKAPLINIKASDADYDYLTKHTRRQNNKA